MRIEASRWWLVSLLASLLAGCASLPSLEGRPASSALKDTSGTRLAAALAPLTAAHPGKTGIHALPLGTDAFAARALLARTAERSIDAQYYIWHADQSGGLLMGELWDAAKRGARVRLLLDDQNTAGLDETLAALGSHPNIEVRLYNPLAQRSGRLFNYLYDFERVNRRMHNKSFTVDGQVTIVGGRNVGNEYFGAGTEVPFKDLDVIAIGPSVRDVEAEFDLYWNSPSAYPVRSVVGPPAPGATAFIEERFATARADPESRAYLQAVRDTPLVEALLQQRLALDWAESQLVADDPAKTLDTTARTDVLLLSELISGVARPRTSFDIISPYFVPGAKGSEALERLVRSGVRVRVLTNSLAGTDVGVVHSGYSKRRCGLARNGVRLYELKPAVEDAETRERNKKGSSAARLHAKTFQVDGEIVFAGSFNFDPRSALLNTEMGLVIRSPVLAKRLAETFDTLVAQNAYEVRARDGDPCIEWIEHTPAGEVRYDTEPHVGWGRRTWIDFLTLLPIDWLL
jgi:putative cardiolipin synthase